MSTGNRRLLRAALSANALFSAICGVVLLIAPGSIAALLGTGEADVLYRLLGAGLLVFAADIGLAIREPAISPALARMITAADVAWVVGTAVLLALASHWFSATGIAVIVAVAAVVALFAGLQGAGLRGAAQSPAGSKP